MEEFLFKNISHITYLKTRACNEVEKIPQGSVYRTIFDEVEKEVANEDEVKNFWGDGIQTKYKALKDRWSYKRYIGTVKYIEEKSKYKIRFVHDEWLSMPELTVHFLDQTTHTLYFTTDDELDKYIKRNFSDFRVFNNKKKIRI